MIERVNELRFRAQTEKHELSHLYEAKIKNMGNAGRNGGEYYTPRPLIRAMIKVMDPKIGERIYDGACGLAGFLCEAFEYLSPKATKAADLFDVLAYVAFALAPQTRWERADKARAGVHQVFNDKQQAFVDFVLDQYVKEGVKELNAEKLTPLLRLRYKNAISDAVADLGNANQIRSVFVGFQKFLYEAR